MILQKTEEVTAMRYVDIYTVHLYSEPGFFVDYNAKLKAQQYEMEA
jgi:hypothetical protein